MLVGNSCASWVIFRPSGLDVVCCFFSAGLKSCANDDGLQAAMYQHNFFILNVGNFLTRILGA